MTPTMEEVAGWLREAALSERAISLACLTGLLPARFKMEADERSDLFDSRAAQVEAMVWRPIEEAPKNERVLLWAEGWYAPNTGEWAKTGFSPDGYRVSEWTHQPTHFRPNVEPPVKN